MIVVDKKIKRIVKYGFFGLMAAGLEFLVFILIVKVVPVYIASTISFSLGLVASFLSNKYIVFNKSSRISRAEVSQFVLLGVVNSQVSSLITVGLAMVVPASIAKITAMAVIAAWNYVIMGRFIFKSRT